MFHRRLRLGPDSLHVLRIEVACLHEFHAFVDVLPEQGSRLGAIRLRQKVRSLPGRADGNRFVAHERPFVAMTLRDDAKCEGQHKGRQPQDGAGDGGDRRFLFILRPPVHGMPQPVPDCDRNHHDDDRAGEDSPNGYGIEAHER